MKNSTFIPIGKTGKSNGVNGALKIFVDDRYEADLLAAEVIFLEISGKKLPYFVEDIWEVNDLLIKLEEIDSPESAHALAGCAVFLRSEDLLSDENRASAPEMQFERYVGYLISDIRLGAVGRIEEIIELPQQFLAAVQFDGRELLIPLHPSLIKHIDAANKEMSMDLPEGIMDI